MSMDYILGDFYTVQVRRDILDCAGTSLFHDTALSVAFTCKLAVIIS